MERRGFLAIVCSMACIADSRSRPHIGPTSPLSLMFQVDGDCHDAQIWLRAKGGGVVVADCPTYISRLLQTVLPDHRLGFDPRF